MKGVGAKAQTSGLSWNGVVNAFKSLGNTFQNIGHQNVSGNYSTQINSYAKTYGVNPSLVKAVAMQESSLGKSSSNVMQVNGMNGASPEASIKKGTAMLSNLLKKTNGNVVEALAAYNMGEGILSYFKSHGGYSVQNMQNFSNLQKQKHGYKIYGDPYYVDHVLRYYK